MKTVSRSSISDVFVETNGQVPAVTTGGARIKVYYAGACYTNKQVVKSGQRRPHLRGIHDTSLFPGYEVSGIVDEVCASVTNCRANVGDRVIVYPTDDDDFSDAGYAEYVLVKDANNLIPLPDNLPLDVAAMLPSGALLACSAVERARPFIEHKLQAGEGFVNVLIVGAGGLSLWTLVLAKYYIGAVNSARIRLVVADSSVEKLMLAREHGSYDIIHTDDAVDEGYIEMRIKNACKGGVDAVIDFVSSARTVSRSMKVLKEGGVIIVGGNSKFDVPIALYSLATHGQSIVGVHRGTRDQLAEIVELVACGQIKPPIYSVYPVTEANLVFKRLSSCEISGRAVLRVCTLAEASSDSVFYSASQTRLMMSSMSSPLTPAFCPDSPDFPEEPMLTSPGSASEQRHVPPFYLPNN